MQHGLKQKRIVSRGIDIETLMGKISYISSFC